MNREIPFGHTPEDRAFFYKRVCDLPAVIHPPETGRITVTVWRVWALTMPATLGQAVRADLDHIGHGDGPIISHPRSGRWSFLVRPDLPADERLFASLDRLGVSVVREGGEVALPSPADRGGLFRRWINQPDSAFRVSGAIVVGSIRLCAERSRMRSHAHV